MAEVCLKSKAADAAREISRRHNIDFHTAHSITLSVWKEAEGCIRKLSGNVGWQRLSFGEKAYICQTVVKNLLDRKRVGGFLSGGVKGIV